MSQSTNFPLTRLETCLLLALGVVLAFALPAGTPAAAGTKPADLLEVTDARTCAAYAVYVMDGHDDWALNASVAAVMLNSFDPERDAQDCGIRIGREIAGPFSQQRWQFAVDVVAAVESGDYALPADCLNATHVVLPDSDEAAFTTCVIDGFAFVGGAQ